MKLKKWLSLLLVLVMVVSLVPTSVLAAGGSGTRETEVDYRIVVGEHVTEMQEYAAKELRKYLYQLSGQDVEIVTAYEGMDVTNAFVVGTLAANSLVAPVEKELASLAETGAEGHKGEQGYVLKKTGSTLYIAGTDDEGVLYGVYGLLDDYYGIGFYFSGDVIPEQKTALTMPEVDEAKCPRQYMRGILPWTNFPQSATSYTTEDWEFVIDQMARMRMNFLNIHNYNGFPSSVIHNEVFHNFEYNGVISRQWNATASTGHGWHMPGWDVNEYRFGATDLFDDYDFGTDATLYNANLSNLEIANKGWSQFQHIIDYAHSRGVKMGLGLDGDVVMSDYGVGTYGAGAEGLPEAQAKSIAEHYPDLDVLIIYKAEGLGSVSVWEDVVKRMSSTLKAEGSTIRMAISGWGVSKDMADAIKAFDPNIIVAPISGYRSDFENETTYAGLEYWAGPWMEKDFNSSVYFYPFNFDLQDLIDCYQRNKDGMEGLFTLTWRLTDAVDAKISYVAKAPWDLENEYTTAEAVYGEYAERCYGVGLDEETVADLTDLICNDEKTVVPTTWSECNATVNFTNADRSADIANAQSMIDRVDAAIAKSTASGCIARLNKLRDRLVCAQTYCKLDQSFNSTDWENLQDDFSVWAQSFMTRVDDISSLGNNVSAQNRFVQQRYVARETALRNAQEIKAPLNVVAKGTYNGARLTWEYESNTASSFNIYRNGEWIGTAAAADRSYTDVYNGTAEYTVTAVVNETEGTASIAQTCDAGAADVTAPQAIVVSPSTSMRAGQDLKVKARLLDGRDYSELRATIHYRALGSDGAFTVAAMENRVKSTFTAQIDTTAYADTGIEYYLTVSDGKNQGVWPVTGGEDGVNAVCTVYGTVGTAPAAPANVDVDDGVISWSGVEGAHWYKIYRDTNPDFTPSMANFVTYVAAGTTAFQDVDKAFDGTPMSEQTWYYRITAVDRSMNESAASKASPAVKTEEQPVNPLEDTLFRDADELSGSRVADQAGSRSGKVVAYVVANGYAKFEALSFSGEESGVSFNAVDVTYATQTSGGGIEIRLDAPDGKLVGKSDLPGTGGWGTFKTVTVTLDPAVTGTHDVYFVYTGGSGYLYNLDYFRFKYVAESEEPEQPEEVEGITITANDLMVDRGSLSSNMTECELKVTNFGNANDRLVLGKGFRAGAENQTLGGGTRVVGLPGNNGLYCFAYYGSVGTSFGFTNLPAGHVYLGFDKWGTQSNGVSVYVDEAKETVIYPGSSGSDWNNPPHKIMYMDAGVDVTAGQSIKFQNDVANVGNTTVGMNGVKVFVATPYTTKQLDITYSNSAKTQCGLYVNGGRVQTVVFANSNGVEKTVYLPMIVKNGVIELRIDDQDLEANGGNKTDIFSILLCEEAHEGPKPATNTITVTCNEGGKVEAVENTMDEDGVVTVETGSTQVFTIKPDEGYCVENVRVNGANYGAIRKYTFQQLTYDATLEVVFAPVSTEVEQKHDVLVEESAHGRIVASVNINVRLMTFSAVQACRALEGANIVLDVYPDNGYRLKAGTLCYVTESGTRTAIDETALRFVMPGETVTVTAEFETTADRDALRTLYEESKNLKNNSYTDESWNAFQEALENAQRVLNNNDATQAEVDAACAALQSAKDGLKKQSGFPIIIVPGDTVEKPAEPMDFTDVSKSDWFYNDVKYVYENGIMNGTGSSKFSPSATLTRAMVVTILYRMEGEPSTRYNAMFSDVENYQWYTNGVEWAAKEGIVLGYTNGKFGPNDPVTREQLAAILYRYAQSKNYVLADGADLSAMTDASDVSSYAVSAVKWAVREELLDDANGKLLPRQNATRAEVAHAIAGFYQHVGK